MVMQSTKWTVNLTTKTAKSIGLLPENVRVKMFALLVDLETNGASLPSWPHYSKLGADTHHCHIKRGRPTYVVCWQVISKKERIIEVYYAGTHEKAPY